VRTLLLLAVAAIFLSSCSSGSTSIGTPSSIQPATVTATATVVTAPTPGPVATPTPTPVQAAVSKVSQTVHAWKEPAISEIIYEVIIEVKNSGSGWAELSSGSDYTIYDKDGGVTSTGSFRYYYPRYLGPGETGYLLYQSSEANVTVAAFASVEASVRYKDISEPGPMLSTDKIKLKADWIMVDATGTITNTSTTDVSSAVVGVVYFDSAGNVLTYSWTYHLVQNLAAGQTKGFSAVGSRPVTLRQIATYKVFASSTDF
jgi:hypothetical protein